MHSHLPAEPAESHLEQEDGGRCEPHLDSAPRPMWSANLRPRTSMHFRYVQPSMSVPTDPIRGDDVSSDGGRWLQSANVKNNNDKRATLESQRLCRTHKGVPANVPLCTYDPVPTRWICSVVSGPNRTCATANVGIPMTITGCPGTGCSPSAAHTYHPARAHPFHASRNQIERQSQGDRQICDSQIHGRELYRLAAG